MDSLVARFRDYLAFERRASPHTVRAYLSDLGELYGFVERRRERPPEPRDANPAGRAPASRDAARGGNEPWRWR